jgi:hypothetical protein
MVSGVTVLDQDIQDIDDPKLNITHCYENKIKIKKLKLTPKKF